MTNLKMLSDEELVCAYAQGNNLAFDILLNRHEDTVYSYIYFIVKNRELAEDIFQETLAARSMQIMR